MPNLETSGKLILAFVTLLIGAILIGSMAGETQAKTTTTTINNEVIDIAAARQDGSINAGFNFTVSNNPTGWKVTDCPLTNLDWGNTSESYILDTDYTVDLSNGQLTVLNTSTIEDANTNTTNVDYNYCANDYLNSTWGRTSLNLVPGFFAIAILLASVGLFFSVAKDYGII